MFYVMRTAALEGFAGAFDSDFWVDDVVRAAQTYPAVWHAGLALAATHCTVHDAELSQSRRQQWHMYALQQYGKCIRCLLAIIRKQDINYGDMECVLLSNIMLFGFCCLQQDTKAAARHMENGLRVFYEWHFWERATTHPAQTAVLNAFPLVRLFRRFELQCPWSDARRPLQLEAVTPSAAPYTTATEACSEFLALKSNFSKAVNSPQDDETVVNSLNNPVANICHSYGRLFSIWKSKLEAFLESQCPTSSETESILILQIWSAAVDMCLHVRGTDDAIQDIASDVWRPTFERIAALTDKLWHETEKNAMLRSLPSTSVSFTFSLSVCEPLVWAELCCDGAIRHQITSFLRKWPRRDGLWDPIISASIVEGSTSFEQAFTALSATGSQDRE